MSKERAIELIGKSLADHLSRTEEQELEVILKANPELAAEQNKLEKVWNATSKAELDWTPDVEVGLKNLKTRISKQTPAQRPTRRNSSFMKIAAVGIILLGLGFVIKNAFISPSTPLYFVNQDANIESIEMNDGSTILLTKDGELTFFPAEKDMRKLSLKGKAFFDVTRDESKPFIVETAMGTVEVLGTSFEVEASKDKMSVTVKSGKVKVTSRASGEDVLLEIGESVAFTTNQALMKTSADVVDFQSYDGMLKFENKEVEEVMKRLEWNFGKKMIWDRAALNKCSLTSDLTNKTLDQTLAIVAEILNLKQVEVQEDKIILTGGTCK